MKNKIYIAFGVILCILSVAGCYGSDTISSCGSTNISSNLNNSSIYEPTSNGFISSNNENNNMILTYVIPQSFEIYDKVYEMIINYDKTTIEIDILIGHIIYEKDLTTYKEENPLLIPVINNYFKCTGDRIAIYTINNVVDGSEMDGYLGIQYKIENIIKKDIFKLKEDSKYDEN